MDTDVRCTKSTFRAAHVIVTNHNVAKIAEFGYVRRLAKSTDFYDRSVESGSRKSLVAFLDSLPNLRCSCAFSNL